MPPLANFVTAVIGLILLMGFVFGLSYSISVGFAGFKGGLPFMIITILVVGMAVYNFWEDVIRGKKD